MKNTDEARMDDAGCIGLGLSPCPNDTYIFHALLHGLVKPEFAEALRIRPHVADVENLNNEAIAGRLDITKISLGVLPHIANDYVLLSSGAALGWGCGPLVVARKPMTKHELSGSRVAIPGRMTTASLLLDLHGGFGGERVEMLFSDIMPAVASGAVDVGVIIHEGRFTYPKYGLYKILDLGEWWEDSFGLPLPLGAIAARRDLPVGVAGDMEKAIARSIEYARTNPDASKEFIRLNAQEMDEDVTRAHIRTFVTEYSLDLGDVGRNAINRLVGEAWKLGRGKSANELFL